MFGYYDMIYNYEERKVDNYKNDVFTIDTAMVSDRPASYETAISHSDFREGNWIILGWASTKEAAQLFHDKMVKFFLNNDVNEITDAYEGITFKRELND